MRLFAALLLAGISISFGQYVPGRYIVELDGDPAAVRVAALGTKHRSGALQSAALAVRAQQQATGARLVRQGARVTRSLDTVLNALIVEIAEDQAPSLAAVPGVKKVYRVREHKLHLDRAVALSKIPDAWNQLGGMSNAGAGIKIGIVDTGIDIRHPGFSDANFPDLPEGFPKLSSDSERQYTNKKVIVARSYDPESSARDVQGHGSSVAMAAAGVTNESPLGPITGAAPRAWLGNYKVFADNGTAGRTSDELILPAFDDAVKDGMDVLNVSLGSVAIDYMAEDVLVQALETAVKAGLIVVASAGNDGPERMVVSSPSNSPLVVSVCNTLSDRYFGTPLTLDDGQVFDTLPNSNVPPDTPPVSAPLADVADLDPSGLACGSLPAGGLNGRIALILRGSCNFSVKLNNAQRAGAAGAIIYSQADNPANPWNPEDATLPAVLVENAVGVKVKQALAARPGLSATLEFRLRAIPSDPNGMNDGSSRGPGPEGQVKPDVCATGSEFISADVSATTGRPTYSIAEGTSLSAPVVAGAAALLKQSKPGLTTAQYRSLLINSATPLYLKNDLTKPIHIQEQGTGLLNAAAALSTTLAAEPVSLGFGFGGPKIDRTLKVSLTNTGSGPETYSLTVAPIGAGPVPRLSATSLSLEPGASQEIQVAFQADSLSSGPYQGFVVARGSSSPQPVRIPYWYGVTGGTVKYVPVLYTPEAGDVRSQQFSIFRILDESGIPVEPAGEPVFTVVSGNGAVIDWGSVDDVYPNVWAVLVRLGPTHNTDNVFEIRIGDVTRRFTIHGR